MKEKTTYAHIERQLALFKLHTGKDLFAWKENRKSRLGFESQGSTINGSIGSMGELYEKLLVVNDILFRLKGEKS